MAIVVVVKVAAALFIVRARHNHTHTHVHRVQYGVTMYVPINHLLGVSIFDLVPLSWCPSRLCPSLSSGILPPTFLLPSGHFVVESGTLAAWFEQ